MANVTFPRKAFEQEIKLTPAILERIPLFSTPLESLSPEEIELEIFPNRPDLLSMQGYLRGLKAFLGKSPGLQKYKTKSSGEKLNVEKSLPEEWPYAYACIVKNLKFDDARIKELIDLQEKLGATLLRRRKKGGLGLYPLEKITFPITFKGLEPNKINFRPLEGPKELSGRQILSRHPTGRTYGHLVESWSRYPIFVDAKGITMSMPPIINSHEVGKIDETTTSVFLEVTGTDPLTLQKALNIMATTLADMGGTIHTIECTQQDGTKQNVPDLTPQKNKISLENTNKLLGLDLKEKDLAPLLERMGHEYKNGSVKSPAWRTDILHEVDLIEDIAIAYGYDKIKPEIPEISTVGQEDPQAVFHTRLANLLTGLSLTELSTFHLIKINEAEKMKMKNQIEVEDSKTDYKLLRSDLITPSLRILQENKNADYPQNLFEIGTIFSKENNQINESESLQIILTPGNFTQAKQHLDAITQSLDLHYDLEESEHPHLVPGRTGTIKVDSQHLGLIGEVHPAVLKAWGLKFPAASITINLNELFKILKG